MRSSSLVRVLFRVLTCLVALTVARPAAALTALRTNVYHQITALTRDTNFATGVVDGKHSLVLSADGRKAVFTRTDTHAAAYTNYVYTINFDGTGLTVADVFPATVFADCLVDISADGSTVLGWINGNLHVANADGSNRRLVLQINSGFSACRLAADGSKIFFMVDRNFTTTPDTGNREPGWYVVNADGTGLREIIGAAGLATYFGVTVPQLLPSGIFPYLNSDNPSGWQVSADGTKLVFIFLGPSGWQLLGMNTDGTGLHNFPLAPTGVDSFKTVGLSGDGSKLFYYLKANDGSDELGVFNWDASGRRVLLTKAYPGYQNVGQIAQLTHDGTKLLLGRTGFLINTDGSGIQQLGYTTSLCPGGKFPLDIYDGFYNGVMNSNGTRFAFLTQAGIAGGPFQIATAEVNPPSLGQAPTLANLAVNPPYIVPGGSSPLFTSQPSPTPTTCSMAWWWRTRCSTASSKTTCPAR